MTNNYKNELVNLAKKVLKPNIYVDTRLILGNSGAIPEPGGSLSVSNYASKRKFSAIEDNIIFNILRINATNS